MSAAAAGPVVCANASLHGLLRSFQRMLDEGPMVDRSRMDAESLPATDMGSPAARTKQRTSSRSGGPPPRTPDPPRAFYATVSVEVEKGRCTLKSAAAGECVRMRARVCWGRCVALCGAHAISRSEHALITAMNAQCRPLRRGW
jgi:hypothetical protein